MTIDEPLKPSTAMPAPSIINNSQNNNLRNGFYMEFWPRRPLDTLNRWSIVFSPWILFLRSLFQHKLAYSYSVLFFYIISHSTDRYFPRLMNNNNLKILKMRYNAINKTQITDRHKCKRQIGSSHLSFRFKDLESRENRENCQWIS